MSGITLEYFFQNFNADNDSYTDFFEIDLFGYLFYPFYDFLVTISVYAIITIRYVVSMH